MSKMGVSYKPLFKLLIDRDIKKKELAKMANISIATITKMGKKNQHVSSDVLCRICEALGCKFGDILEFVPIEALDTVEMVVDDGYVAEEEKVIADMPKPVETPAISITDDSSEQKEKEFGDYTLTSDEQDIVHYIYEQLQYYRENPPQYLINQEVLMRRAETPDITCEQAAKMIPEDRFYSLVLNEVFEKWKTVGWEFDRKRIPFELIASGYFEPEETFGEITMQ